MRTTEELEADTQRVRAETAEPELDMARGDRDELEAENERLREALSPSAKDLADRVRHLADTIRRECVRTWDGEKFIGTRGVVDALPDLDALAAEIELLTGDGPANAVLSVDLAAGPDQSVEQDHFILSCPAGCEHRVTFPSVSNITDIIEAFEQAGVTARETKDGSFTYDVHKATGCSSVTVGEPVKSIAEYSEDITDPLATALEELGCAILEVDSEKAWALTGNTDRDLWISSVEQFMAAMLKWAQGMEQRRADAVKLLPGELTPTMLSVSAALAVHLGHPALNPGPTKPEWQDIVPIFCPTQPNKGDTMKPKTLHNSNVSAAHKNVKDLVVYGNGDLFKLLCKASSESEGWMKSTKVMEVGPNRTIGVDRRPVGCLVQVTTQQRNQDGSYAVAEALTFVPGATFRSFEFPEKE